MKIKHSEWRAEAAKRYGNDSANWTFRCPSCGHATKVSDWKAAKAPYGHIAYSCVGRALGSTEQMGTKNGPCNYAGGGLFKLNPVIVIDEEGREHEFFDFADDPLCKESEAA